MLVALSHFAGKHGQQVRERAPQKLVAQRNLTLWRACHAYQSLTQTQKSNITHKDTTISICSCRIPWQIRTFWLKDLDVIDVKECFAFQRLFGARIGDIEGTAVRGSFCDVACRGNCPILGILDITL
jgi:hypothetical protein